MNRRIALFGKKGLTTHSRKVLGISRSNLLAYYPCNGNAKDYSGNGFNGVVSNVTYGTGIGDGGKAATFAGTGYINVLSAGLIAAFNGAEGTLSAWLQISDATVWADGANHDALFFYTDINNYVEIVKAITDNRLSMFRVGNATTESRNQAQGPGTAYFHMTMTWSESGDKVIYYIAGSALETDTVLGAYTGNLTKAIIGAGSLVPSTGWKGSIAHVALWNTPLSGANVTLLATV